MSTTYQDLLAQKAALDKQAVELERQIAQAQKAENASVIAQIKALMTEHGLTVSDLGGDNVKPKIKNSSGSKVAPKYRNALTGETWTGRGLKPKWIVAAMANGKKLEDFAI